MKRTMGAALCAAALLFAACGESDDSTTTDAESEDSALPSAEQPLDEAVAALNEAIENQDCEAMMALTFSQQRLSETDEPAEPDQEVLPEECAKDAPIHPLMKDLEGTVFEDTEESGPVAISSGPSGKTVGGYDNWNVTWVVDRDGMWRQIGFSPGDPQANEDLPFDADPADLVSQMVDSAREEDCSNAEEVFAEQSIFASSSKELCEQLAGGSIFAPAVRDSESVSTTELMETLDHAFVGVDTGDTYFVASAGTPPTGPDKEVEPELRVTDVYAVTDFEYQPAKEKQKG
jgi:hypothetical protein